MGLDMYLNASRFLCHTETDLKVSIAALIVPAPGEPKTVTVEACYWRKANAIHAWFVKNVQKEVDDCGVYYVSLENITTLRDLCRQVLADPSLAPTLLPAQSGFFFGSTAYDDNYLDDLRHTDERLTTLIDNADTYKNWSYEYHSSW